MAFTAGVSLVNLRGAGEHGIGIEVKAATVSATPQTVNFYPFKLTDYLNVMVLRDAGPNDTAGALTSVSLASTGLSITFTPAATGNVALLIVGAVQRN